MNTKMKALSLALVGLAGFGFAGAAAAGVTCPSSAVPPWTAVSNAGGSVVIAAGGLDGSACRLDTAITSNLGFASAYVSDATPAAEPTYRAQFIVNADALTGLNISQIVRLYAATTSAPAGGVPDVVAVTLYGNVSGTSKVLGFSTACASSATGRCSTAVPITTTGPQTVEIQWIQGATGELNVWLNNNTEGSPDATLAVDNSAWGGVDDAFLGLYGASAGYRASQLNNSVQFDTFDSRRTTFIGF